MKIPTPFYNKDGIVLYNADCRDVLPHLKDNSIDLCLTDPPYGVGEEYASYTDTQENLKSLIDCVMSQILRVSHRVLLTSGVSNLFLYPKPVWILAWVIPAGVGRSPWGFGSWQPILAYGSDPYLANGMGSRPDILIHTESAEKLGHPCTKPIVFWQKILLRGSVKETDVILDPFCGSGTTLVAAKRQGRKAIGIEMDRRYCGIAVRRLDKVERSISVTLLHSDPKSLLGLK